ncbi:hypothetical protein LINBF2_11600 [Limnohabitans sp. INBF002]|nr:hypothetical protein LINBF2_11600 [Limnohabitans sp. INBF002]
MSAISKHMPARVDTSGRSEQMQCVGTKRQPAQRSPLGPPRARKGLTLRARRVARKRATAWGKSAVKAKVEAIEGAGSYGFV